MKELLIKYKEFLEARNQSLIYHNYIRIWLKYCSQKNIDYRNITQDIITSFFNSTNYKSETKNLYIKSAQNFYGKFLKIENEWLNMKYVKTEEKIPEYFTYDDIKRAERYLATYSTRYSTRSMPEKEIALIYLMFLIGMRKKEVLLLKRKDFDFQKNEIKIYNKKSKKEKKFPLLDEVKEKIQKYFKMEKENTNAFNITETQINYLFRIRLTEYLGRKIKPHLTRYGAARYMHEKGIPLKIIQDILEHKDIKTTMRYIQYTEEQRNQIYKEKLNG